MPSPDAVRVDPEAFRRLTEDIEPVNLVRPWEPVEVEALDDPLVIAPAGPEYIDPDIRESTATELAGG